MRAAGDPTVTALICVEEPENGIHPANIEAMVQLIQDLASIPRARRETTPPVAALERVADPEDLLKEVIAKASGVSGRRLDQVKKRFSRHRRQLLERLDRSGPVTQLPSWQHFVTGIEKGLEAAGDGGR